VAIGNTSLNNVTTGSRNTGVGYGTLRSGNFSNNTAVGWSALISNTNGGPNVAVGAEALISNTFGDNNNAVGFQSLASNLGGTFNNAHGNTALATNVSGDQNNAFGDRALFNATGSTNTAIGDDAGLSVLGASGVVAIGDNVFAANVSNTTWIRNIGAVPQASGVFVTVDHAQAAFTGGQYRLGFIASSRRYKQDIQPMDKASETLYRLKPVTYRVKGDADPAHVQDVQEYGLIAEDVAEVNRDLVVYDNGGEPASLRFFSIQGMLLNEFLKEHKKVQDLEATVALQQKGMEVLTAQLKEQAAQIHKVSAQLELIKSEPRTVLNK
jgi:uncharacterized coiled-coil protein SlyX